MRLALQSRRAVVPATEILVERCAISWRRVSRSQHQHLDVLLPLQRRHRTVAVQADGHLLRAPVGAGEHPPHRKASGVHALCVSPQAVLHPAWHVQTACEGLEQLRAAAEPLGPHGDVDNVRRAVIPWLALGRGVLSAHGPPRGHDIWLRDDSCGAAVRWRLVPDQRGRVQAWLPERAEVLVQLAQAGHPPVPVDAEPHNLPCTLVVTDSASRCVDWHVCLLELSAQSLDRIAALLRHDALARRAQQPVAVLVGPSPKRRRRRRDSELLQLRHPPLGHGLVVVALLWLFVPGRHGG